MMVVSTTVHFGILMLGFISFVDTADLPGCNRLSCEQQCNDRGYSWSCKCSLELFDNTGRPQKCWDICNCENFPESSSAASNIDSRASEVSSNSHPSASSALPAVDQTSSVSRCNEDQCERKCSGNYKWRCDDEQDICHCLGSSNNVASSSATIEPNGAENCNRSSCSLKCEGSFSWTCSNGKETCICGGELQSNSESQPSNAESAPTAAESVAFSEPSRSRSCSPRSCSDKCPHGAHWHCENGIETCTCLEPREPAPLVTFSTAATETSPQSTVGCSADACDRKCNGAFKWSCIKGVDSCVCQNVIQGRPGSGVFIGSKHGRTSSRSTGSTSNAISTISRNTGSISTNSSNEGTPCNKELCRTKCEGNFRWFCDASSVDHCTCTNSGRKKL